MTKPTLFEIVYDNPAGVYKAGELVKGTVNLELPEELKVLNVRITLVGEAKLKWMKAFMMGGSGGGIMPYDGEERYFKQHFFPEGDSKDGKTLSAGTHSYPFQIKLTDNLPSSFEHKVGKIRYWTECCIDRKTILKAFNYMTQKAFSVVSIYDLNTLTDVTGLFEKEDQLSVCCWCCAGTLEASFRMKCKAFVPGELMTFDAEVSNLAPGAVSKTEVVLKQVVKFITTDYQNATKRTRVVRRLEHGPIPSKGTDRWVNEGIIIPPLPPTGLKNCRVIKISYVLELNVNPSEVAPDICLPLDIIIGNVPLKDNFDNFNQLASKANVYAAPPTLLVAETGVPPPDEEAQATAAAPIAPFLPNCPPPTYHESVFGMSNLKDKDDKEEEDGEVIGPLKFAPVYLTYHYDNTPFEIAIDE